MSAKKILAVCADRYRLVQHSRDELLRNQGYLVQSTSDIQEALNYLAETKFDLVLLCHTLDYDDRKRTMALAKMTRPETPVVILSAGMKPKAGHALYTMSDPQSILDAVGDTLGKLPQSDRPVQSDRPTPFAYRILVVDDDPLLRDTAAAVLESQAYEVHTAQDGIGALKSLGGSLPDVVITDLRMSNMSGFELLAVIRKRFPQIATIAMSDELAPATQPDALLADAFLEKGSYSPEQLFYKILELLRKSPLRSNIAKPAFAPIWIARMDGAGKSLLTCTSCLRSSPVALSGLADGVHQHLCPSCGDQVTFDVHAGTRQQWQSASRPSGSVQ